MATYSFHILIMAKVEIGNFYCLIEDNRLLFLQKCLLNCSPHFIRLFSELLNLIGCQGNINSKFSKKVCFSRISRLKVTYMFMALTNSLVVLFYCCATADILTKLLQQCFLFFIVVVITGQWSGEHL